jgi:hypothetical protein
MYNLATRIDVNNLFNDSDNKLGRRSVQMCHPCRSSVSCSTWRDEDVYPIESETGNSTESHHCNDASKVHGDSKPPKRSLFHLLLLSLLAFQLRAERRNTVPKGGGLTGPADATVRLRRSLIGRLPNSGGRLGGRHHPLNGGPLLLHQDFVHHATKVIDGGLSGQPVRIRSARWPPIHGVTITVVGDGSTIIASAVASEVVMYLEF